MALFGKADELATLLRRIEADTQSDSPAAAEALVLVAASPDFQIDRNVWMFFHPSRKVREFAGRQLGLKRSPSTADAILRDMPGRASHLRQEVARLVVAVAPDRILVRLGQWIHSTDAVEKEVALDLIEATPRWQDLLSYLKVALKDHEPRIRQRAARILVQGLENPTIFFLLRELVHDEDEVLRHVIIEGFARKPTGDIVEPFFERLTLEGLELRTIMTRALSQLAKSSQSQIEERILPMLGDENPAIREIAAKLLGEMPDRTRVLRAFLVHCRTIACWLKERSIQSLSKSLDSLVDSLIVLMQDPDDDLRVNAMLLASNSRHPDLLPLIKNIFLGESDWWIRSIAADLLGNYPDVDVVDTLIARIDDADLRYSVISVLGKLGGPRAVGLLLEALEDPQRSVRSAALNALREARTPVVADAIGAVARSDPDAELRDRAHEIVQGLGEVGRSVVADLEARRFQETQRKAPETLELSMANESLNR